MGCTASLTATDDSIKRPDSLANTEANKTADRASDKPTADQNSLVIRQRAPVQLKQEADVLETSPGRAQIDLNNSQNTGKQAASNTEVLIHEIAHQKTQLNEPADFTTSANKAAQSQETNAIPNNTEERSTMPKNNLGLVETGSARIVDQEVSTSALEAPNSEHDIPQGKFKGLNGDRMLLVAKIDEIKRSVCKIEKQSGMATGFFCKVSIDDGDFYFLCTNNHVISKKELKRDEIVCTLFDGSALKLSKSGHNVSFGQPYDVTFVEVSNAERYKLEFVRNVSFQTVQRESWPLLNKTVNILQHANGDECQFSEGIVMEETDFDIQYTNNTSPGSSGSPVFDNDGLVVAVHKHSLPHKKLNGGLKLAEASKKLERHLTSSVNSGDRESFETYKQYRKWCSANLIASIPGDENQQNKRGFLASVDVAGKQLFGVFLATTLDMSRHETVDIGLHCRFCDGESQKLVCLKDSLRVSFDNLVFLEVPAYMIQTVIKALNITVASIKQDSADDFCVAYWDENYDGVAKISNWKYEQNVMKFLSFRKTEFAGAPVFSFLGNIVAVCNSVNDWADTALQASYLVTELTHKLLKITIPNPNAQTLPVNVLATASPVSPTTNKPNVRAPAASPRFLTRPDVKRSTTLEIQMEETRKRNILGVEESNGNLFIAYDNGFEIRAFKRLLQGGWAPQDSLLYTADSYLLGLRYIPSNKLATIYDHRFLLIIDSTNGQQLQSFPFLPDDSNVQAHVSICLTEDDGLLVSKQLLPFIYRFANKADDKLNEADYEEVNRYGIPNNEKLVSFYYNTTLCNAVVLTQNNVYITNDSFQPLRSLKLGLGKQWDCPTSAILTQFNLCLVNHSPYRQLEAFNIEGKYLGVALEELEDRYLCYTWIPDDREPAQLPISILSWDLSPAKIKRYEVKPSTR